MTHWTFTSSATSGTAKRRKNALTFTDTVAICGFVFVMLLWISGGGLLEAVVLDMPRFLLNLVTG